MKRCVVCRQPYYRRNLSIVWRFEQKQWKRNEARGHPQCLRILQDVTRQFVAYRKSVA